MNSDETDLSPSSLIGFKVRRLHHRLNRQWASLAERHGVRETPVQAGILAFIAETPGMTHAALAARMGIDGSTLSQALAPMVRRRLVRRETASHDRRTRLLFLTRGGAQALDRLRPLVAERRDKLAGKLDPGEIESLHRLLDRMLADGEGNERSSPRD